MIKSIVKKTLGLKRHCVKSVADREGRIVIELETRKGWRLPCRVCGELSRVRDRLDERTWRHVPLWGIPCELRYRPARVRCSNCRAIKVEAIPWSYGKSPLTIGLIWLLSAWAKLLAWKVVADQFGVHWNSVQGAVRQAVDYGLKHRELGSILCIGIDELSRKKGHVYVTNVYDLEERRLIWSGEGRSRETLKRFLEEHGEALKDQVIGVCCDMWQPYLDMIKEQFPNATLIFDKFHIVQHLNKAVDEVRKEEARELKKTNPE